MTPAARAALEALYRRVAAEVARLKLTCDACGACCRFDEADHTLFASGLEAECALAVHGRPALAPPYRCPYQIDGRCTAREARPLGCRLHFCRVPPEAAAAREALAQEAHETLKAIHERHGAAWDYRPFLTRFPPGDGKGA